MENKKEKTLEFSVEEENMELLGNCDYNLKSKSHGHGLKMRHAGEKSPAFLRG